MVQTDHDSKLHEVLSTDDILYPAVVANALHIRAARRDSETLFHNVQVAPNMLSPLAHSHEVELGWPEAGDPPPLLTVGLAAVEDFDPSIANGFSRKPDGFRGKRVDRSRCFPTQSKRLVSCVVLISCKSNLQNAFAPSLYWDCNVISKIPKRQYPRSSTLVVDRDDAQRNLSRGFFVPGTNPCSAKTGMPVAFSSRSSHCGTSLWLYSGPRTRCPRLIVEPHHPRCEQRPPALEPFALH